MKTGKQKGSKCSARETEIMVVMVIFFRKMYSGNLK